MSDKNYNYDYRVRIAEKEKKRKEQDLKHKLNGEIYITVNNKKIYLVDNKKKKL